MTTPIVLGAANLAATGRQITSYIVRGLAVMFLAFDAGVKVIRHPAAIEATATLGFPTETLPALGALQLILLALYCIPRTAPVAAVLWTGYLGGAVAIHVRAGSPMLTHTLFPVWVGALLWAGLALRNRRLVDFFTGRN